jgi:hypothetical protein
MHGRSVLRATTGHGTGCQPPPAESALHGSCCITPGHIAPALAARPTAAPTPANTTVIRHTARHRDRVPTAPAPNPPRRHNQVPQTHTHSMHVFGRSRHQTTGRSPQKHGTNPWDRPAPPGGCWRLCHAALGLMVPLPHCACQLGWLPAFHAPRVCCCNCARAGADAAAPAAVNSAQDLTTTRLRQMLPTRVISKQPPTPQGKVADAAVPATSISAPTACHLRLPACLLRNCWSLKAAWLLSCDGQGNYGCPG